MLRLSFLLAILLGANMVCFSQTEKRICTKAEQENARNREEQKRLEAIQDSLDYVQAVNSLENLDFVLEADRLIFKRGRTVFVTSMTNFVSLLDDEAVVQVAPFNGGGGPNGVGGITVEGKASNIKLRTDKKGNSYFSMSVMGTGISASVDISLVKGSNRASVTISPNFNSNRITLEGRLLPSEVSTIFKGRAL